MLSELTYSVVDLLIIASHPLGLTVGTAYFAVSLLYQNQA
jgi:hypothetical protein